MNLSIDVFERRTSAGGGLFSFLDGDFAQIFGQIVSITVKTLRNTNLAALRCFKMKKIPLPIDMRRSKRLCLSFLVINFATKPLKPVEQGILPPAAYTLGTLVKKQFLSVAKLLLGSCEGKTENRH